MPLDLTFIPPNFWNRKSSNFHLLTKGKKLPADSGFFFLWDSQTDSLEEIEKEVATIFPKVPVAKLLSCSLRIAKKNGKINPKDSSKFLKLSQVQGKIMPLLPAIKILFSLNITETIDRSRKIISYSDSIKTWAYLTKFTMELLSRGNFIPYLDQLTEHEYKGQWKIILKTQQDHNRINNLIRNSVWASYPLPIDFIPSQTIKDQYYTSGLWHPSFLFAQYIDTSADMLIRSSIDDKFLEKTALRYNYEFNTSEEFENACADDETSPWDLRFLTACIGKNNKFQINRFCDTPIPGILRNWVQNSQGFSFSLGFSFSFRLDYPKTPNADWVLGYYLQPFHEPDNFIPLDDLWDGIITHSLEYANVCDEENKLQEEVLRALGTARKYFPPISRSLDSKNPQQLKLKSAEVMEFLRTSMYLLIQAGFEVVLPEQFRLQGQQRLSARMVVKQKESSTTTTRSHSGLGKPDSLFDINSMMEYHWEAQLEGKLLTEKEFLELANSREPLIFWRDQWILVDPQDMENLSPIFKNQKSIKGEIPYLEALKLGMAGQIQVGSQGSQYVVELEGEFQQIVNQLSDIESFSTLQVPETFHGNLRAYQETALTWLGNMAEFNFGVCLADDMGLGKTVEVISFLEYRKEKYAQMENSILIICPTSVLFNWKREIQKFAPNFDIYTHHGPERKKEAKYLQEFMQPHRIILTTYGTVRNDIDFFETIPFTGVILDESQNIKNYKTQQTQAILRLKSQYRIALSGTPIENRLLELWTLFQFLNPGLLGKRAEFQKKFVYPIERFHSEQISAKLQRFISPFILRRLKSDKNIIKDLPEKNEIKVYLQLAPEQAKLYAQVVNSTMQELENLEQNQQKRRGLILRLLTHTKQICNHPFQYLHLGSDYFELTPEVVDSTNEEALDNDNLVEATSSHLKSISLDDFFKESVKMGRLIEMIDEILEDGEKILIFTQFKQMGTLLQKALELKYKLPILFFHGGIPQNKRGEMVDDFQSTDLQSPPVMILSLRAGGTGLNLTQASTVFHFDRWWNPAVEDQATDRAYRIGQQNRVNVYKFVSTGTIEEKIDQMLEEKRDLADRILTSSGETWITSLSNEELRDLFSLNSMEGGI
ncbi:RNA polymerase-associated protein RapA [Candidatus Lokiarchaeum ossiferum]|uniref:RNA polymerase-associated protein RapA n=1 Tax=Candidatus Lokiarchaeum ossiferum TaxID=2951803 RepID=A0ABY6HWK9_9ARCH|nr:RNA polymerase-associated protein RapA [Candidatus Lokiarchaeum sp. B-35]